MQEPPVHGHVVPCTWHLIRRGHREMLGELVAAVAKTRGKPIKPVAWYKTGSGVQGREWVASSRRLVCH